MKTVKKLLALAVLLLIGYGALWFWQGPFFALMQIDAGIAARDPGLVERYADLDKLVASSAQVLAQLAKEEAGISGGDLGSALLGALVGVVASEVGKAISPAAALEMRRAIQEGTLQRGIGPFVVNHGVSAFGDFELFDQHATVTLKGVCRAERETLDAKLKVVLERRDAGVLFGLVTKHVLVGVDKDSVKELAKTCRAAGAR